MENEQRIEALKKKPYRSIVSRRRSDFEPSSAESTDNKAPAKLTFRGSKYQNLGKHQDDPNYGCPVAGSKTEFRGKLAGVHVSTEIVDLCSIIQQLGTKREDGIVVVPFGILFQFYTQISNKLVGMLIRARRHGLIHFEGEMLYQRQDEQVPIYLLQTPEEMMEQIEQDKDELRDHQKCRTHMI